MRQRVAEEVRHHLTDARRVAVHRSVQHEIRFYGPRAVVMAQFIDNLTQHRLELHGSFAVQGQTATKPASGKIEDAVDQARTCARRSPLACRGRAALSPSRLPLRSSRTPPLIPVSGLRRSWPRTAMNCSRKTAFSRSARSKFLVAASRAWLCRRASRSSLS